MAGTAGDRDPLSAFTALNSILLSDLSVEDVLQHVAREAKAVVGDGAEVSVTLIRKGRPSTVAATGELAADVDETQYKLDSGPCLEAARQREPMLVEDVATEARWPDYTPRALAAGVGSSVSLPLPVVEHVVAALNVYAREPHAFDEDDLSVLRGFAAQAGVAVANTALYELATSTAAQLETAMRSRAIIEQAKGILMGRDGCDAEQAFATLARESQTSNRKLRDIAQEVVDTTKRRAH